MAVEWNAHEYARQSTLQQTLAEENLAKLTLIGSERVLDIGCGDGKITTGIADRLPRGSVVAVDPSMEMIAFAARTHPRPNLRFEVGDARHLAFHHEFDVVVSFYALHWVLEQDLALRSVRAALKPAGRTLLQFVHRGERPSLEAIIDETRQLGRWASHFEGFVRPFAHFTPDEYAALAERNGLRVVQITPMDRAWDFDSRAAFAAFCRGTFVAWTRHLPTADVEEFIGEVLDRYRAAVVSTPAEANTFKFYQMAVELTLLEERT